MIPGGRHSCADFSTPPSCGPANSKQNSTSRAKIESIRVISFQSGSMPVLLLCRFFLRLGFEGSLFRAFRTRLVYFRSSPRNFVEN